MSWFVDVHTHLTHKQFEHDYKEVLQRAKDVGLGAVVINGLGKSSNRQILELAHSYPIVKAALGIYPIEAAQDVLGSEFTLTVEKFSLSDEIEFIREKAKNKDIVAVGEC